MVDVPFAVKLIDAGIRVSEKSAGAAAVTESEACVLTVAPAMVGAKPYLPLSLLNRIASQTKNAGH